MAFPRETARTAASIRDISIELADILSPGFDLNENGIEVPRERYRATFNVQIVMSDGSVVVRRGNLVPHTTTAQRNALVAFVQSLRAQAEAQLL